jgi:hypothetical protein
VSVAAPYPLVSICTPVAPDDPLEQINAGAEPGTAELGPPRTPRRLLRGGTATGSEAAAAAIPCPDPHRPRSRIRTRGGEPGRLVGANAPGGTFLIILLTIHAAIAASIGISRRATARVFLFGLLAPLATFAWATLQLTRGGADVVEHASWTWVPELDLELTFRADGLSIVMLDRDRRHRGARVPSPPSASSASRSPSPCSPGPSTPCASAPPPTCSTRLPTSRRYGDDRAAPHPRARSHLGRSVGRRLVRQRRVRSRRRDRRHHRLPIARRRQRQPLPPGRRHHPPAPSRDQLLAAAITATGRANARVGHTARTIGVMPSIVEWSCLDAQRAPHPAFASSPWSMTWRSNQA